jgi:alkanesulfonate monooxygenase SsuD/methylene tetrahydromethanopterin reductase-like flavin-dependent oxidoreductase (luciferase family)
MWLTTDAPPSLRMAAKHRYGLLLAGSRAKLAACVADFRGQWQRRHDDEPRIAVFRAVHIANSRDRAHAEIAYHVAWYVDQMSRLQPGQPSPTRAEVMSTFRILGVPAECVDAAHRVCAETELTNLAYVFGIAGAPSQLSTAAIERFAEKAAPDVVDVA